MVGRAKARNSGGMNGWEVGDAWSASKLEFKNRAGVERNRREARGSSIEGKGSRESQHPYKPAR
jgi:hypothetical protein